MTSRFTFPPVGSDEEQALWEEHTRLTADRALPHLEHPWELDGRCFSCARCGDRIGQAPLLAAAVQAGLLPQGRLRLR